MLKGDSETLQVSEQYGLPEIFNYYSTHHNNVHGTPNTDWAEVTPMVNQQNIPTTDREIITYTSSIPMSTTSSHANYKPKCPSVYYFPSFYYVL